MSIGGGTPLFSTKYRLPAVSSCPALLPLHPSWDTAADIFLFYSWLVLCPVASLSSLPQLVLNLYLSFAFPLHLFHCFSSCCHLRWAWGTQSFWGKCKLQAAPRSVCFLIGKQHFRALHWWWGSAKTSRAQEYSLFPGPGCVEVGLSEEGALGREGR